MWHVHFQLSTPGGLELNPTQGPQDCIANIGSSSAHVWCGGRGSWVGA